MFPLSVRSARVSAVSACVGLAVGGALLASTPAGAAPGPFSSLTKSVSTTAAKRAAVQHLVRGDAQRSSIRTTSSAVAHLVRAAQASFDTPQDPDPAPTDTTSDPAPTDTTSDPAPTDTTSDPAPTDTTSDPAPTDTTSDPAPTDTTSDPAPTDTTSDPAPTDTTSDPAPTDTTSDPVPPDSATPATTVPTLEPVGTSGVLTLTADSSAPYVLFEVDGAPVDGQTTATPVAVSNGQGTATFPTWGTVNGLTHTVTAADCASTEVASCNTTPAQTSVVVSNDAPVITAPADNSAVTGGFTVTATAAGGGIRFLVDGSAKGFAASAPYSFDYTGSALSTGSHTLAVVQCSTDDTLCSGPQATVSITSDSLHPTISAPSPSTFSPNGDRHMDTTAVTYSLPDSETATADVLNAAGKTVRTVALGTQSGRHTWTWNGRSDVNKVVGSGRYTIRLSTSAVRNGATVLGSVSTAVTLDTRAPALSSVHYGTSVYPHRDGFRDTFPVSFRTDERATATLVILNARNHVVRSISASHAAGTMTLSWNGTDSHNHGVAAGTYGWYLTWHDAVDNTARTGVHHLGLSLRRLVTKHATITKNGDSFWTAAGSDPSCSQASTKLSNYVHGVWLANSCKNSSDGPQLASAFYHVGLPAALSYSSVSVLVGGAALQPPSVMSVAYGRSGGKSAFVVGRRYPISSSAQGYWRIGTVNPTGLMTSKRVMNLGVSVDNMSGRGDFDIAVLRLTVTYTVLQ